MKIKTLVSICCQVYNHEKFLDQAIKGFLSQQTNFEFEIIIHDDASTDASRQIIENYAKLDNRIKPIFQKENKFSKNERILFKYIYPKCIGEYIAVCDGDDYWTDPLKLQKQVDFLENNVDYGIVGTRLLCYYNYDDKFVDWIHPKNKKEILNIADLADGNFIFSSSVLVRNDFKIQEWWGKLPFCDWPMYLLQVRDRKVKILDKNTGVYRVHSNGIYSGVSLQKQLIKEIDCIRVLLAHSELATSVKSILGNTLFAKTNQLDKENNKLIVRLENENGDLSIKYKNEVERLNMMISQSEIAFEKSNIEMNYYFKKLKRIKKTIMYKTFVKIELFLRRL
jgi:glycosyltransferase involved in cell wall biosynthesis